MKKISLFLAAIACAHIATASPTQISISTAHSALSLGTADDGRLYQYDFGSSGKDYVLTNKFPREVELYPQYGDGFILEPALRATHADGNTSTDLIYSRHTTTTIDPNIILTRIELKDPAYPFLVTLCYKAYQAEDVIEAWTEIRNEESAPVVLSRFASSAPLIKGNEYWLTQFYGDYKHEATLAEEKLGPGMKVLDSKIGVRADRFRNPSFILSTTGPATEDSGEVFGGTLEWSGSFQFAFDIDFKNRLRALCGINPFAEE